MTPAKIFNRLIFIILATLIIIGCDIKQPPMTPVQAPGFILKDMSGNQVKLADLIGSKPLVLDFWATWCGACMAELPNVIELNNKYQDKITVVGINLDRSYASAQKYVQEHMIAYPNLFDEDGKVAKAYGVVGIPTMIIINSQGQIIKRNASHEDVKGLVK